MHFYFFFKLDSPNVLRTSEHTLLLESTQSARMQCEIEANPLDESMIYWQRVRPEDAAIVDAITMEQLLLQMETDEATNESIQYTPFSMSKPNIAQLSGRAEL